ncbi:hypothetical protein H0H87_007280 [Tephrocybe sp. NHM501043]|nr:hypothetical protein H0H87_007280 [Tephrocybe sp. NHM501043]
MSSALLALLALPSFTTAYTWKFDSPPQQCSNLTVSVSGSDGKPPYRILILPSGPSPLKDNIEARTIVDQPFPEGASSVSFKLNYPANSQFVAIVSDASNFGSGGTSVAVEVTSSSDSSCFDASTNVSPKFFFNIYPQNQIVQCVPTRIWWDSATITGETNFLGVIPGGQSFTIPQSELTNVSSQGTGFSWTPSIRGGTTLIIVGGDGRGNGTAGSSLNTVNSGPNNIGSCLNDVSPSSTPGTPAGGSYATGTSTPGSGGGGGGGTNIGAIVGGVVGGVVALAAIGLIFLFFLRRSRVDTTREKQPVNLFNPDDDEESPQGAATRINRNELPEYYQPEPFTVPDPTVASTYEDEGATTSEGRPLSGYTTTSRSGTPDILSSYGAGSTTTGGGRKGPLRSMRPVNIIQHDDAGPSGPPKPDEDVETVELPPAYTNIRQ